LLFLEERAGPFEGQGLPGLLPPPPIPFTLSLTDALTPTA
jgi:hypothetical protein